MKKKFLWVLLIIVLAVSGCQKKQPEINNQTDNKISENKPTENVTSEPTTPPAETPSPNPTPSLTASPAPTATPQMNIEDIVLGGGGQTERTISLDLPEGFFGDGGRTYYNDFPVWTMSETGDIYYLNFRTVYKIDSESGKTEVLITLDEIKSILGYSKFDTAVGIAEVVYTAGKVYLIFDDGEWGESLYFYDVKEQRISENIFYQIDRIFDGIAIVQKKDDDSKYRLYDIQKDEFIENKGFFLEENDLFVSILFEADDYLILSKTKYLYEGDIVKSLTEIFFIDPISFEIIEALDVQKLFDSYFILVTCEDNSMYFMIKGADKDYFAEYNVQTGKINSLVEFIPRCNFIDYDSESKALYMKFSYGYEHRTDNSCDGRHELSEDCLYEEDIETAAEVFFSYSLVSGEFEVFNIIPTKEYIKCAQCINLIFEVKAHDYIIGISESFHESRVPLYYEFKFKIGEDIDYDTWKD